MQIYYKYILMGVIFSLLFTVMTSCNPDSDESDSPSINVSNVILPLDSSQDSEDVSSDSLETSSETTQPQNDSSAVSEEVSTVVAEVSSQPTSSAAEPPEEYTGDWKLILVNSKNLLPSNFTIETANIGNRPMDARIVDIVKQMISDAKKDGVDLMLASSYRTVERQTTLYNEEIDQFIKQGYSRKDAEIEAAKWVAVPGTSEHHTGLALDIVTPTYQVLDFGFDQTAAFKWLYKNCTDYGFILRYPKNKSDITGIVYEPWHYRYVGKEVAKYIHANDLCLEEYIDEING